MEGVRSPSLGRRRFDINHENLARENEIHVYKTYENETHPELRTKSRHQLHDDVICD